MRYLFLLFTLLFALPALAQTNPAWTTPLPPFQIADHLYYVGSEDLAAYLVTTPAGNILINANLETSPPQIRASIEKLGFHWADTKILLNGQAHFDHMGGAAEILRETHARNMVMEGDAEVVESGGRTDSLAATGSVPPYPPAHVDRVLHDGDTVELGGITLTAHKTAGHTRGCTTWTLPVHLGKSIPDTPLIGDGEDWRSGSLPRGQNLVFPYPAVPSLHRFWSERGVSTDQKHCCWLVLGPMDALQFNHGFQCGRRYAANSTVNPSGPPKAVEYHGDAGR